MRFVLLIALAACWTAPASAPESPSRPTLHRKPGCYTTAFFEDWPRELTDEDMLECGEWDSERWTCRYLKVASAYSDLWYWTRRWFEACDPR